jgi:hypothetical protein
MIDDNEADLRELENRSRRKIETPDERKLLDGEICWHNAQRVCGADCIAFNTDQLDEYGSPVQGPEKCIFVVLLGQLGTNSTNLVQLMTRAQAASRTPAAPPPPGIGGNR